MNVARLIILDYTKSIEDGYRQLVVAESGRMSYISNWCSGLASKDVGECGINLLGTICRTGSVKVTLEGLFFSKGAEVLEMR